MGASMRGGGASEDGDCKRFGARHGLSAGTGVGWTVQRWNRPHSAPSAPCDALFIRSSWNTVVAQAVWCPRVRGELHLVYPKRDLQMSARCIART